MRYAIIKDGTVDNVIELDRKNESLFPDAVQTDIAGIGDEYRDGRFYRNGELVKTQAEMYAETLQEMADMQAALELLGVEPEVDDE